MPAPILCLVATPKSHAFKDRRIKIGVETDPTRIGRSVARTQPSEENAIFDCKVLSRNHAVVWYNKGSFYIKDTRSSNGTFLNNEKLYGYGREADARKMFSGDIIQFGVEISETASDKTSYGCVYAVIKCYDEEGKLVIGGPGEEFEGSRYGGTVCSDRRLFQINQYLSEAIHRENVREQKIKDLMTIIEENEKAAETAWKSMVNEERLLARIETLEAQLAAATENVDLDEAKQKVLKAIDEKTEYEASTKESIRLLLEDNLHVKTLLKDMERSLDNTESTCNQLRSTNSDLENIIADTTKQNTQQVDDMRKEEKYRFEIEEELVLTKKKLNESQLKCLELSKNNVENETATNLTRLLANSLNNGSVIAEQELTLLLDSLSNANYLSPDRSSSSDNIEQSGDEKEEIEVKHSEDHSINQENYLKEILELQAKNRELESDLEQIKEINAVLQIEAKNQVVETSSSEEKEQKEIEYFYDELVQITLFFSLSPVFAFLLSILNVIGILLKTDSEQVEEHQKPE